MSMSSTLASALSGLNASSRQAELVSSNIANATTEGYARRELVLTPRTTGTGQGVEVVGTQRITNAVLTGDRRIAQAGAAGTDVRAGFLLKVEWAIGDPGEDGSLTARIAELDSALIGAASRPDADTRLATVVETADSLARHLNEVSAVVQEARSRADSTIAQQVTRLNDTLKGVADLNRQIQRMISMGGDASALMDKRQQMIDGVSDLVPLREVDRGRGQIALYTTGGAVLLDGGRPATVGFVATGLITPEMTLASGALSGLTVNGKPVGTGPGGLMAGGAIAAQFELRDSIATEVQAGLDAVARDLVERLASPGPDTTLAPGDPGLFTDAGTAFDPVNETGLAGRLEVNALVDPARGGALFRVRDGLGAAAPGPAGSSTLLVALKDALSQGRQAASGGVTPGLRSHANFTGEIVSRIAQERIGAEAEASYTTARADALKVEELAGGVDTDREMQDLLVVEKAYAANAKVIQTVGELIDILLGL